MRPQWDNTRTLEREKYMVHEEVTRLVRVVKSDKRKSARKYYVIFRFLAESGVRIASALGLTPADVSRAPGDVPRIRVRWLKKHNPGIKQQELEISQSLYTLLVRFARGKDPRKPLFRITDRAVAYAFKKYLVIAGLNPNYKLHGFRHYHLMTWYHSSGKDVVSTSKRAGHASIASTMIYVHTDPDRTLKTMSALPSFA